MAAMYDDHDDLIGKDLGGCRIVQLLGQGGMAKVYFAQQIELHRHVAVKVLPSYNMQIPGFTERFQQEARMMAMLNHPNIVHVFNSGFNDLLYIVMEYIPGMTLRKRMEQPMTIAEVAQIFRDVAEALTYAHEQHVIHRDVKPVNVLLHLSRTADLQRAVLTDFGIAKLLDDSVHLTRTNAAVGTPEYMSPEQCRGDKRITPRADIYALGILLYEMLCGRPPFEGEHFTAVAHAHVYEAVPPPSRFNQRVNLAIEAVIFKALAKEPHRRFATAREMADALDLAVTMGKLPAGWSSSSRQPAVRLSAAACKQCGAENQAGKNFCSRCGANQQGRAAQPLPRGSTLPQLLCQNCHQLNLGDNRHCTSCGQQLAWIACHRCKQIISSAHNYCIHCGSRIK
ncbi:MAG TPA: serine/threonine-protein kinase [Ktedonobacterales bacterium]|nr:serine/threonine-protein kinase [Ktedonobacterales bacterium]